MYFGQRLSGREYYISQIMSVEKAQTKLWTQNKDSSVWMD